MPRRCCALVLGVALVASACGEDDDGDDTGAGGGALGETPTLEECLDATRTLLDRLEVPADVDTSDGVDDGERASIEAAIEDAAVGIFPPSDEENPCDARMDSLSEAEMAEFVATLDPEIVELLGRSAEGEFREVDSTLN